MSQENVEIVRRCMEAYAAGKDATALEAFDPAVQFDTTRFRPDGKIYGSGVAGLVEALRTWQGAFREWKFDPQDVIGVGDDVVLVSGLESGVGKGSGVRIEQQFFAVFTLREGKIVRWRHFIDKAEALEAAGLRE